MATAEADPGTGVLRPAHPGAWTEESYLALTPADRVDRRVELLDGSLLVAPGTGERHAAAVAAVRAAVAAALPDGLEVTGPVALRLAPGRILVPDLVVAAPVTGDEDGEVRDSSVALVVIDVVGRANGVADRWFKPQLYAGCRIPYALLVDHDEPFAVGSMLIGGRFHEYAEAGPGDVLRLEEPFALELDLAALAGAGNAPVPGATVDGAGPAPAAPAPAAPAPAAPALDAPVPDGPAPDSPAPAAPAAPAAPVPDGPVPGGPGSGAPAAPDHLDGAAPDRSPEPAATGPDTGGARPAAAEDPTDPGRDAPRPT